ncbi:partial DNA-binding transcriptional regulator NtrC, partial [uncultured bacterium]
LQIAQWGDMHRKNTQAVIQIDTEAPLAYFFTQIPIGCRNDAGSAGTRLRLLEHFSSFYARETGQPAFRLDEAARQRWMAYHFPGNVRELRNIIIRLTAKYPGKVVDEVRLMAEFDTAHGAQGVVGAVFGTEPLIDQALKRLKTQGGVELDRVLREWERAYVEAAMKVTHGNLSQAAKLLGINRTTLYSRMQLYEQNNE